MGVTTNGVNAVTEEYLRDMYTKFIDQMSQFYSDRLTNSTVSKETIKNIFPPLE